MHADRHHRAALLFLAQIAHQLHGAIGFTREHALHHFTQRLWAWRSDFGNDRYWADSLGRLVARAGASNLWSRVTG